MKRIIIASSVTACPVPFGARPKGFAQHAERARTAVGVPGMAIAIIEAWHVRGQIT